MAAQQQGCSSTVTRLGIAASLAIILLIVLFYNVVSNFMCFCTEFSDSELAETNGDIKLPPTARNLRGHSEGLNEIYTVIRFEMDADDLSEFIDNSLCNTPLEPTQPETYKAGRVGWWEADKAEKLLACGGRNGPSRQIILIDVSNPNTYIVYVSTSVY